MIFNITTTNNLYDKPIKWLEDYGFTFTYSEGVSIIGENIYKGYSINKIEKDLSLDDLIKLSKKNDIILSGNNIEIYDDYRE